MIHKQKQTFNDGVVKIYEVSDISAPGDKPKEWMMHKLTMRYRRRTIGITRYYAAMQANVKIDMLIRCPSRDEISSQDIAVISGEQYKISQIQHKEEIIQSKIGRERQEIAIPPVMDLTLTKLVEKYELGKD